MKRIKLTQGQFALVDDADYDWLNQWKWYALKMKNSFYAMRNSPKKNGKRGTISMSRQILGLEKGDRREGDHQDHNTLNNQRTNIRICTNKQNQMNQKPQKNTSSKFKGVSWDTQNNRWRVHIQVNKKIKHLGLFTSEYVAAEAYNEAAKKYFKNFAYLNVLA